MHKAFGMEPNKIQALPEYCYCHLEQVTTCLGASVSPSVKWERNPSCHRCLVGEACLAPNRSQSVSAEALQHPLTQLESRRLAGGGAQSRASLPGPGVQALESSGWRSKPRTSRAWGRSPLAADATPAEPMSWTDSTVCTCAVTGRGAGGPDPDAPAEGGKAWPWL